MRVLHIINSLEMGGAERLLCDCLPLFGGLGCEADLFLINATGSPLEEGLQKNFNGQFFTGSAKSLYSLKNIADIGQRMAGYDVVHVHLFPALYFTAFAKWRYKYRGVLIFTEHSTTNRRLAKVYWRMVDKRIYKAYTAITAITPAVKQALADKLNITPDKIFVIHNGINLGRFTHSRTPAAEAATNEKASVTIIQVSRFSYQKDQETVVRALAKLPEQYRVQFCGDGETLGEVQALANELGVTKRIEFLGTRTDVPGLLAAVDIVVQSSKIEGFGLAAVEGMAAGKPVVASDIPGLRSVIDGAGILFQAGDADDLAAKITALADPGYYGQVAARCTARAREYSIEQTAEAFVNLYKLKVACGDPEQYV